MLPPVTPTSTPPAGRLPVLAAIDVGTNAVRLEVARLLPDGSLEVLHEERDPVRPGEGVFATGALPEEVADRLVATLRRYATLCRRFHATARAVATSALREARNRDAVVGRVRREAGLELEVISGPEEARLICLGVLQGKSARERSLVVDIGGGSTEVALATGEQPSALWSVPVGSVRLSDLFGAAGKVGARKLGLMREYVHEALLEALPPRSRMLPRGESPRTVLGSSGTIQALVRYAGGEGAGQATREQLTHAVERLAALSSTQRHRHFDPKRAEIIVGGAVVLEQVMQHLRLPAIAAVDRGLRDGLLRDLARRSDASWEDASVTDAALAWVRRLDVGERHAQQVSRLALALFDGLRKLHGLPASARPLLELSALLHDVGYAVSLRSHHKHGAYLIRHADLPGLTDHDRLLCALVARFHRRSAPERTHPDLAGLPAAEVRLVQRLSTLLRVADTLDRSHHQAVRELSVRMRGARAMARLQSAQPLDLELWELEREQPLFRRIFGCALEVTVDRTDAR